MSDTLTAAGVLPAALAYANRGWYLFPCDARKRPKTSHGFKDSTTDPAIIARWAAERNTTIGLDCGRSGFVVIDLDAHGGQDGPGHWARLKQQHAIDDAGALLQLTPNGGRHLLFSDTTGGAIRNSTSKLAPGVDVRAAGGYVLLAPSGALKDDGTMGFYRPAGDWESAPGPLPESLADLLTRKDAPAAPGLPRSATNGRGNTYAAAALAAELAALCQARDGTRNTRLNQSAFALGQLVAGGALNRSEVEESLLAAAAAIGLGEAEARRTIRSGLEAGANEPRSAPERDGRTSTRVDAPAEETPAAGQAPDNKPQSVRFIQTLASMGYHEPVIAGPGPELPEIITSNRPLREQSTDALKALQSANDPPSIFLRSGGLVRVGQDEHRLPVIEPIQEAAMRGRMARCAEFVRITVKGDKAPVAPPLDIVRDVMSLGLLPFPPLLGLIEGPMIRPDGVLITSPGYDSVTRLYYVPSDGLNVPRIPDCPSSAEVKTAGEGLQEIICDFPFEDEASRAGALAAMLTSPLRSLISGPVPMALVDKPQAGTGASLFADVIAIIATGRPSAMLTAPQDDEGWRKAITSILLSGRMIMVVDNIEGRLSAPSLAAALTATTWQDRVLGRSELITLPHRITWVGTGNNIRLGGDLPRRCHWIRMDAQQARPWQRRGFRHAHLAEWIASQRGSILAAILTLAKAWLVAGRPQPAGLPVMGGFEGWANVIGGILTNAGIPGFLGNLDAMYELADDETPQWEAFLGVWHELWGDECVTVADIVRRLPENAALSTALPDDLADGAGKDAKGFTRRLGKALSKRAGVHYPSGLCIKRAGKEQRAISWQVINAIPK